MEEMSLPSKIDMLISKSQYLLALGLASTNHSDPAQEADIHRKYADYLYEKGDFDGAMSQFLDTIGYTEPSYVIRKVCSSFFSFPLYMVSHPISGISS